MKLSIITINLNDAEGLKKTIQSVVNQTVFEQIEYIIIDGGSTDNSPEVIEQYASYLSYYQVGPDRGIYKQMNKGVSVSSGEYLLFLNSGDNLHNPTAIESIFNELNGIDLVIGEMVFLATGLLFEVSEELSLLSFMQGSLPHNATFIKRNWLEQYPYDESLKIVSDWKFFVQAIVLGNASYKIVKSIISDFDCNGISSKNRDLCEIEKESALKEMFPQRVLDDYRHFLKGGGYEDTPYDRFYIKLRNYRYGKVLYSFNVFILRIIACFKKGARFSKFFPLKLNS